MTSGLLHGLITALQQYGLLGVFMTSFIGNLIPYSAIPYPAFIAACAATSEGFEKIEIVLAGGIGASLGKFILYGVSRYAGRLLSEKRKHDLAYFKEIFSKRKADYITIFLFAALPLPDDVLYVPLGIAKYDFAKFAITVCLGKIFLSAMAAFMGSQARWLIGKSLEGGYLLAAITVLVIATIVLILLIVFVNWRKVAEELAKQGVRGGFKVFIKEMVLVLTFRHPNMRRKTEKLENM